MSSFRLESQLGGSGQGTDGEAEGEKMEEREREREREQGRKEGSDPRHYLVGYAGFLSKHYPAWVWSVGLVK